MKMIINLKYERMNFLNRPKRYNTKQSEEILLFMASVPNEPITVGRIAEHFINSGIHIGTATIYRRLDELVKTGRVRKYIIDGETSACCI
jgi:Fe2+ or Zn2+ uptake regulation protein